MTEFGIKSVLESNPEMKFFDINRIPVINYGFLDELKESNPELLIRRNQYQDDDFKKDNALRVPRRYPDKKKKKKGKKGGKKKK